MPESFRVLMKEFQALGLDISIIDDEGNELDLKVLEDDETKEDLISIDEKLITPIGQDTEKENTSDFDFGDGDDDDLGDLDEDEFPDDEIDADFDDMMEGDE